jgi:hypothetical protein
LCLQTGSKVLIITEEKLFSLVCKKNVCITEFKVVAAAAAACCVNFTAFSKPFIFHPESRNSCFFAQIKK